MQAGRLAVRCAPTSVSGALRRALEDARRPEQKSLVVQIDDGLIVIADSLRLEQILVNLLTNAYRYGGDEIRLDAAVVGERIHLTVSDNGDGIPAEDTETLFEVFSRGSNSADTEGSGLGLAIARGLALAFGGNLSYERSPESGTRFTLDLLRAQESGEYSGVEQRPEAAKRSVPGIATIMIVDDDPDIRFILRMFLEDAGYGVIEAKHGAEALHLVPETNPDLVIADIMMPVMDGLELIARLRSDPGTSTIPILVLSSRGEAAISADVILRKPCGPDEVLREVASLLDKRA